MKKLFVWAILLGAVGYGGAKLYLHNEISGSMDAVVLMLSPYASVRYDGVVSTMSGELAIEGMTLRVQGFRDEIYIDSIGIDTPSFLSLLQLGDVLTTQGDSMPEHMSFIVKGLRMPANADYYRKIYEFTLAEHGAADATDAAVECVGKYGFSPRALAALGYSEQVFSMSMSVRDEGSMYSLDLTANVEDMWDFAASIGLSGNMMKEMSKGIQYRPKLATLDLEFVDRSLHERVAEYCRERGLSPEETLTAQLESFKYSGEYNGIEFSEFMLDPYREFLQGKSTLAVSARPNSPILFSQIDLYKPSDVPALLNLRATTR